MSVAMVYNCDIRNNGTGILALDAMRAAYDGEVVRYTRPYDFPKDKHSFYLMIDDGRDDIDELPPSPNAFWAIDTHLGYDKRLEWGKQFDVVWCAQKDGAAKMQDDGVNAHWLPLACSASAHPARDYFDALAAHPEPEAQKALFDITGGDSLDKTHDVCFVGFMNQGTDEPSSHNRVEWLDHIFKSHPNAWLTTNCFWEHMAFRYIRARVGLNISIRQDLNMRFFEIPSTGTFMMSNRDQVGWEELGYEEGVHFDGFESKEEACDKITYWLENPDAREKIAQTGHDFTRNTHTYIHRMKHVIGAMKYDSSPTYTVE